MQLLLVVLVLLAGSLGSVALAGSLLFIPEARLQKLSSYLISIAGGTLLGAAFIGMLPKAVSLMDATKVFRWTMLGILAFFLLEKIILWRICNNKNCERHNSASAQLILVGDAFHNFIDGVIIITAFITSSSFGFIVALTVFAHEVPQELADFGILLKNGFTKKKALLYNMISGSTALLGGLLAYFALESAQKLTPYILAISASSFIYIALADLVPSMHKKTALKDSGIQFLLIISGILIIYIIKEF